MRSLGLAVFGVLSLVSSAHADVSDAPRALFAMPASRDPWLRIDWLVLGDAHHPRQRTLNLSATLVQQPANRAPQPSNQPVHAVAIRWRNHRVIRGDTEFRTSNNDAPNRGDRLDQRRICRIPTHAAGKPLT